MTPYVKIAIDVAGPFPMTSNNKYILIATDNFKKLLEAYTISNQEVGTAGTRSGLIFTLITFQYEGLLRTLYTFVCAISI